ncbi:FtsK/SpoIIIE domain-containing protein [Streptomyces sp. NPDC056987]|uniref:FtsK/SpoIIIE domain-containing protein n=1 Tax=Streptomyces sp. NPDC056987 TaxID=3345988 RepID=UPI0036414C0F
MAQPSTTADTERSPLSAAITYGVGIAMITIAASRLLDIPQLLPYGLGAAVLTALLVAVLGSLVRRRTRPVRDLYAALAPVFGPDFTREHIKADRRRHGIPTRVRLTYPTTYDESDEKGRARVRDIIAKRLGGSVEATWQPPRRRLVARVELTPDATDIVDSDAPVVADNADDTPERARLRGRTTDVVQSIMGPTARVADVAFDGDRPNMIEVRYLTTSRDLSQNFRQRVIMQLDTKLPGEWRDTWDMENDTVRFELRPPFPTNVRYPILHKHQGYELPYSVTENHCIESWKLGSKDPHCLVVGPTGSGKTVFIRNLVVGARMFGIPVVLCDPKMTEYLDFVGLPGVRVITDPEEIAAAITHTHDEMMRRYNEIKDRKIKKGKHSKILFVLDEFFVFREAIQEAWDEKRAVNKKLKRIPPCFSHWRKMIVLARTAGIHLVVGIQRPDAEFLSGLARDSLRKRISLDRTTAEAARMMWGDSRVGADLPSVQGRAIASTDRGPEQVQVLRLLTPEDDDAYDSDDANVWDHLVRQMNPAGRLGPARGEPELAYLGALGEWTIPQSSSGVALPAAPAPVAVAAYEQSEDENPHEESADPDDDCQPVGVYELDVEDEIQLPDEDDFVEIADLHFGETDDEEWVEIEYRYSDGGTGVHRLTVEDVVNRRVTQ